MRLTTILTLPAATPREKLRRLGDWGIQKVARALPARLRYWAALQAIATATIDSPNVPATPLEDIVRKLPGGPR